MGSKNGRRSTKGNKIDFKSSESYDAVDVKEIITAIEKKISESIRSNLEAL